MEGHCLAVRFEVEMSQEGQIAEGCGKEAHGDRIELRRATNKAAEGKNGDEHRKCVKVDLEAE